MKNTYIKVIILINKKRMFKLRDYQEDLSNKAKIILDKYKFVMLNMEVRTWKTFTALTTIEKYKSKKVLFLTKKKAISSIESDYKFFKDKFEMVIINYESVHKVLDNDFDLIVLDESHWLSTYPKPWLKYKNIKKRFGLLPMILLTWTPTPESYSQYFHQVHVSKHTVWKWYTNFYKWATDFVKVWLIKTSYGWSNDYSRANYDKILHHIWKYILTYTQKKAGFTTTITEKVLHVKMKPIIYELVNKLKKDKVIEGTNNVILADTKVKEMQKIHQIMSGSIKFEDWRDITLDKSKWEFIKKYFKWQKIAIFYLFKQEQKLLQEVFWDTLTDDLEEFNTTDKHFCTQIVKGREWISLAKAESLIFYNIAFSALSYHQARDRLSTKDRKENKVYWIFSEDWLEDEIYKTVLKKKSFTSKLYEKTFNNK